MLRFPSSLQCDATGKLCLPVICVALRDVGSFALGPLFDPSMSRPYSELVKPELLTQPVYQPGKPIEEVARELGLDPKTILKLASNENPLGTSPKAIAAAKTAVDEVRLYPDGGCYALKQAIAGERSLDSSQIIVGNGSNEVLELIAHAFIGPGDEAVMGKGAFIVYKLVTLLMGGKPVEVPFHDHKHDVKAMAAAVTDRTKVVFLPSPDNPSGSRNSTEEILELIDALPDHVLFVLDEAYVEYLEEAADLRPAIAAGKRVFCTRTFSKIYGLAGLRVGYGYGDADLVGLLNRAREPFNVSSVAQAAAVAAVEDQEWVNQCRLANTASLQQLEKAFASMNLEYISSSANFVTVKIGEGAAAFEALQRVGVIVRPLAPYGMPDWIRVSAGTEVENERALREITSYLNR